MKKTLFIMILVTALSKLFGFGREMILSYMYGITSMSDAYIISLTIPSVVFLILGEGIKTTYIPMYNKVKGLEGEPGAVKYTNELVKYLLIFCTVIVLGVVIFTEPVIKLFASGFNGETLNYAASLTRVAILSIYFIALSYVFIGYLQLKQKFFIIALLGIPLNVINIIFIIISKKFGFLYLGIGQVIAVAFQIGMLLFVAVKQGYHFSWSNSQKNYIKTTIKNAVPVIIGKSVHQVNKLIDRTIASSILIGGISTLVYANRLNLLIQDIFILPFTVVMYPIVSKLVAEKNIVQLKQTMMQYLISMLMIVIPTIFGGFILSDEIIFTVYRRGAFSVDAVQMTSAAFKFYLLGMFGITVREIFSNVFFSLHDTKTPMINSVTGMSLNIVLNLTLSRIWGLNGIALASSISIFIVAIMMAVSLSKKIGSIMDRVIVFKIIKLFVISCIMAIVIRVFNQMFLTEFSNIVALIISVLVGAVTYCVLLLNAKISEVDTVRQAVRMKISNFIGQKK